MRAFSIRLWLMDWWAGFLINLLAGQQLTILSSITIIDQHKFISETGVLKVLRERGFKSVLAWCENRQTARFYRRLHTPNKDGSSINGTQRWARLACVWRSLFPAHRIRHNLRWCLAWSFGSPCLQAPHKRPSPTCSATLQRYYWRAGRPQTAKPTIPDLAWKAAITKLEILMVSKKGEAATFRQ